MRVFVAASINERVSDIVDGGEVDKRLIKLSMAATGFVRRGSSARI